LCYQVPQGNTGRLVFAIEAALETTTMSERVVLKQHGVPAAAFLLCLLTVATVSAGTIDTVAGTGEADNNGDQGEARSVDVGEPFGVEIGPDGALDVTEVRNHRVRRVRP
jgi:hypothetical protein